jgi:hypothetical protein
MTAVIVNVRDAIGARGEIIFSNLISKFHADRQGPIPFCGSGLEVTR